MRNWGGRAKKNEGNGERREKAEEKWSPAAAPEKKELSEVKVWLTGSFMKYQMFLLPCTTSRHPPPPTPESGPFLPPWGSGRG